MAALFSTDGMAMRSTVAVMVMAALTMMASAPAQAWSGFGHRLVGLLAQEQLSEDARAQVDMLLADEPGADLGTIAAWADEIREQPEYRFTAPFHYVNFPLHSCDYQPARDCPEGACIIAALERYRDVLADASQPLEVRREALKFVVHFTGDVHQPMHAGNRGDRGGNRFQVNIDGKGSNLHAVWDFHLLNSAGLRMRQWRERLAPQVAQAQVSTMQVAAWAGESCAVLDVPGVYPARPGRLPAGYLETHRPLAEQRVVLAAARLAALLERALAAPAVETGGSSH